MGITENGNRHCARKGKERSWAGHYPLLSALLIALVPKCSLCLWAYTGAITVCSTRFFGEYPSYGLSYVPVALSLFTLGMVMMNYRGVRTLVAGGLVVLGMVLIAHSIFISGRLSPYYWGSVLLLIGVWANGSLWYVARMFRWALGKRETGMVWPK